MNDFIKVYENVLDDDFCDELCNIFDESPYANMGQTGGGVDKEKKVSSDLALFRHQEYNDVLLKIMPKLGNSFVNYLQEFYTLIISMFSLNVYHPVSKEPTRLTAENFDEVGLPQLHILMQQLFYILPPQLQKYHKGVGNYAYWHSGTYPELGENHALHRVLLYILYLNDVEEGGETEFLYQNKKIKPKKGSLVIAPSFFTHTHRGNVPISNDKYILTSWMQFKDAKTLYGK